MRRREFISLLGGAAAARPLAALAQQPDRVRRIGVLMILAADDPEGHARLAAFTQGLQGLGWTVGHNVQIDYRWGAGDADHPQIRGGIGGARTGRRTPRCCICSRQQLALGVFRCAAQNFDAIGRTADIDWPPAPITSEAYDPKRS